MIRFDKTKCIRRMLGAGLLSMTFATSALAAPPMPVTNPNFSALQSLSSLSTMFTNMSAVIGLAAVTSTAYYGVPDPAKSGIDPNALRFDSNQQSPQVTQSLENSGTSSLLANLGQGMLTGFFKNSGTYLPPLVPGKVNTSSAYCVPASDTWISNSSLGLVGPKFNYEGSGSVCGKTAVNYYEKNASYFRNNAALRVNTLLNPDNSDVTKAQAANPAALDFISFVSGLTSSYSLPQFISNSFNSSATALASDSVKKMFTKKLSQKGSQVVEMRTYLSQLSVAVNNLYHIYLQNLANIPNPQAGKGKYLIPNAKGFVSRNQMMSYLADHRLQDPNWAKQLLKANPAALMRQQALMQAINLMELDKIRQSMQRLTASMSTMQMELLAQQKKFQAASTNTDS